MPQECRQSGGAALAAGFDFDGVEAVGFEDEIDFVGPVAPVVQFAVGADEGGADGGLEEASAFVGVVPAGEGRAAGAEGGAERQDVNDMSIYQI